MSSERYDLIVIGGGSGGLTAAVMAGRIGAKTLLVDKTALGGDCLHAGCVPSKALIASAKRAHLMRTADDVGVGPVEVEVDFASVMARLDRARDSIGAHESPEALGKYGVDVRFGGARFVDEDTVRVGDALIRAKRFIIATGSRAHPPPIPGLDSVNALDNEKLFKLTSLPGRLVVIGGGPIGVEMGQAFARLGSRVTIVQQGPRLLAREEPDVAELLLRRLRHEGIEVLLDHGAERVERTTSGVRVHHASGFTEGDDVLVAVGRRANVDALDLDAAGVETNKRGVVTNDTCATTRPHIFAVGDVAGGPQFTHWAEYEARIATRNALFMGSDKRSFDVVPWVTFTDPEVARVGLTEAEARKKHGGRVHTHTVKFDQVDRAVCDAEDAGFLKAVVDDKGRIYGVHIIGHAAGEALSEWVLAITHGLTLHDVGAAIHPYPTYARVNRRVADERFFTHGVGRWTTKLFGQFEGR